MSIALDTLKKYWNYDSFRPPQDEIVHAIIDNKNVIGLLPTGAGKSICFQVPGLARDGLTLVISPLIALMEDQVHQLKKRNIPAVFLHSGMHKKDIDVELDNAIYGKYKFLYISPERIHSEIFIARAHKMKLSLIAVDEAHCISQWGHDFRKSYTNLLVLQELFPKVPISAFTATATSKTLVDIKKYLGLEKALVFKKSFVKENLSYTVINTVDKQAELMYLLARIEGSGIIYARNRKQCENLAIFLNQNDYKADYYHAGLSYDLREKKQSEWVNDETHIMVSTNAFGMGIDKPNVRWVIHIDIPGSLEEYYQEAGRAGRDGALAHALLLFDAKDEKTCFDNLEISAVDHKIINDVYDKICRFLNIPMGGGQNEMYLFPINEFCSKYNYPIFQVLAVLRVLVEYELIFSTEGLFTPSKLMFFANREQILRRNKDDEFSQFILSMVRNYEGLFSHFVKISEEKIMRFTSLNYKTVIKYLQAINNQELGQYIERSDLPRITMLSARTEAKSLDIDYTRLEALHENKLLKQSQMIDYIHSETCREQSILAYFSERNSKPCGRCDICKGSNNKNFTFSELNEFHQFIIRKLTSPTDVFDVLHWWPLNKRKKVMAMLSVLENEKKIQLVNREITVL